MCYISQTSKHVFVESANFDTFVLYGTNMCYIAQTSANIEKKKRNSKPFNLDHSCTWIDCITRRHKSTIVNYHVLQQGLGAVYRITKKVHNVYTVLQKGTVVPLFKGHFKNKHIKYFLWDSTS